MQVRPRRGRSLIVKVSAGLLIFLVGCGSGESQESGRTISEAVGPEGSGIEEVSERLALIDEAVNRWQQAQSMAAARGAAEAAANLIVGPNGPGYGDRDGDGQVAGASETGLLPGLDGTPRGLAFAIRSNPCVSRDVLGGSWEDPGEAWGEMLSAIEAWEPGNNTMPTLPSHPMRVIGWATFTLQAGSLDLAHEYASHANLHVRISADALDC